MRLRNNMTTMESCNSWSDVCPRKCRPPRIGDIPKHGAVDEESPSSSSRELTTPPLSSSDSTTRLDLERPAGNRPPEQQAFTGLPGRGEQQAPGVTSAQDSSNDVTTSTRHLSSLSAEEESRRRAGKAAVLADREYSVVKPLEQLGLCREEVARVRQSGKSRDLDDRIARSSPTAEVSEEESEPEAIHEVRKDSALYLEASEVLPSLRDVLKTRGPRILVRPRRESSGYASIISTFDEDRRNSCCTDVLQDAAAFARDRRRSSAKRSNSRILLEKREESLEGEASTKLPERMPTTEVYRKVSGAGLEMPNIEVVKEVFGNDSLEIQSDLTSARISLSPELNTEKTIDRQPSVASSRCRSSVFPLPEDPGKLEELDEALSRLSLQTPRTQPPKHWRTLNHQCSAELASIVEKPAEKNARPCQRESSVTARDECEEDLKVELRPEAGYASFGNSFKGVNQVGSSRDAVGDSPALHRQLPKSVKVYQLLSTQSEDRGDGELARLSERRVSLEITTEQDEIKPTIPPRAARDRPTFLVPENSTSTGADTSSEGIAESTEAARKLSSSGEVEASGRFLGDDGTAVNARPIYPYCPYSPYASPQGSPRNRRRPLRESRRVSIDNRQGALQLNQYKLLDNIGQGSYGIVKLAYNEEDKTHYAMKILSKKKLMKKAGIFGRMAPGRKGSASPLAKVYREIALLKKLDHPNVVKLVEVLDDPDEDNLYLVFELVQKGEILQIPTDKPLDEETARVNFRDVVLGVEYLHYQRIVHRDIKPSNLLVDSEGRIKIADLGVSAELRASGELLSGTAGTPAFAAPETTTPGAHYSGTLCDVWSMGVTLFSLVTGRVPWDGAGSIVGVQAAIRTEPLRFPETPALSEDLRNLISRTLAKDPAERITLARIKEHPWLTKHGAEPLPSESDNCRLPVTVTDEEVERVVTRVPKLDTLILIKTMLKQHSFQNPFMPKRSGRTGGSDAEPGSPQIAPARRTNESLSRQDTTAKNTKAEQFHRSGRSNSAPDSYDWQTNGRQISIESSLPPVSEVTGHEFEALRR